MQTIKITAGTRPLLRTIAYWVTTSIIFLETATGAEWDLVRNAFVRNVFDHLGYPHYLLSLLGAWKLPAAIILIIPGFVRVREWAYAGLFFVYTGAAASHFILGQTGSGWGPLVFAALTMASRALRPRARKLSAQQAHGSAPQKEGRGRKIGYWASTGLIAFCMISGGLFYLSGDRAPVAGIKELGYPAYFLLILGVWKVLGGLTIVLPRLQVLKEWAYAGIVFDLIGAAVSNAVMGKPWWHVAAPLFLTGITIASWALRPASRSAVTVS
ncbi:MAG TPA: DoxX family protein [Puia sp.]|nr:DoxX family protein [Puia sp.]